MRKEIEIRPLERRDWFVNTAAVAPDTGSLRTPAEVVDLLALG